MGGYWAVAPISFLVLGFLAVLACDRTAGRRVPPVVGVAPTFLALGAVVALYANQGELPLQVTIFTWSSTSDLPIALAYYVDAWGALFAILALFLGLCTQLAIENWRGDACVAPRRNWDHLWILGSLAITLNLVFSASLAVLFMCWSAIGLSVYVFHNAIEKRAPGAAVTGEGERDQPADKTFMLKQLAGYALLGSILLIVKTGNTTVIPANLRTASLGLAASVLVALALGVYLGLYPFNARLDRTEDADEAPKTDDLVAGGSSIASAFLSALPVLASVYVLGRLYPMAMAGSSPAFSTILALMGLATIVVASVGAWRARELRTLLANAVSVELGFVAVAFAMGDITAFSAGLLIFLNGVLASQAILLANARLTTPLAVDVDAAKASGAISGDLSRSRPGSRAAAVAAPWLSLIGLPFTLGFVGKWLLFGAVAGPKQALLWPIGAIASGLVIVATLRFLDQILFAGRSLRPGETPVADPIEPAPVPEGKQPPLLQRPGIVLSLASISPLPWTRIPWTMVPWVLSLMLGLMPNQTLRWIIRPATAALVGEDHARLLAPETALSGGVLTAVAVVLALAVAFFAFFLYPVPLARLAIAGPRQFSPAMAAAGSITTLRFKTFEAVVDIIAAILIRISAMDSYVSRVTPALRRVSILFASLSGTVQERYYFPALTVLGIVILFLFLG